MSRHSATQFNLEELSVDARIILKCILEKYGRGVDCNHLLSTATSGGLF